MNYGLLKYKESPIDFNVGDYIQSLAAKQYLPQVDQLVNREQMGDYNAEEIAMILNGWFCYNAENWVPSKKINPLFVSFHINSSAEKKMLSSKGVEYFKAHSPIGCRDNRTAELLKQKGVEAFYSGCLTLTLDNYKVSDSERTEDIYIVDPFFDYPTIEPVTSDLKKFAKVVLKGELSKLNQKDKLLELVLEKDLINTANYTYQVLPAKKYSETEKFEIAESLLRKYARAKFVITSRIHCALPCLAMGTPVIFLDAFDRKDDTCRFDGITGLFNTIKISQSGEIKANFELNGKIGKNFQINNPNHHVEIANKLKTLCKDFISKTK
ncbi:polysaccharide pyruvyl transferase family protein [Pseudomonas helleri]|uniref:polysaccharide pyruvyl transferase family protein n=1 Tax=Pseudomonas helleri TaxID=1608996 RepID=UPI003FD22FA9